MKNRVRENKKSKQCFDNIKPTLEKIAIGITTHFGPNCEVVVHNLTNGYEKTIEIIENGHVTNRKVGDDASEIVLEALSSSCNITDELGYKTVTKDGRIIKSSTIYLHGADNEIIGIFGINFDITDFTMSNNVLNEFLKLEKHNGFEAEKITNNVNDLLETLIEESVLYIGKPVANMTKHDKIKAIQFLDKKGAFLIQKSGDKITQYYDISKFTLYNYLNCPDQT